MPARLPSRLALCTAFTALAATGVSAQQLTRPGEVTIEGHIVVTAPLPATDARVASLKLPPGFHVARWADGLETPRVLAVAPNGDVYASSLTADTVTLLHGGEHADSKKVVLTKKGVQGLAIHDGTLFYTTPTEVYAAPIQPDGTLGAERQVAKDLPDVGQHNDRTIKFGPDGWLYEAVGSDCNECDEKNPESATMVRIKPDGSGREIFASGLRNTIGFAFRDDDKALWGWDDGVDWLGDDAQREELNHIEQGRKYGWPYVFGDGQLNRYRDPPKGQGTVEQWDHDSVRPVLTYTAHSSGMELIFYDGQQFPQAYRGDAFATLHGSWNRRPPSGYEIVRIHFDGGKATTIEPFLTGFLSQTGRDSWARFARPFGLAMMPDGSLLMGEDQNGVIYRITYATLPAKK